MNFVKHICFFSFLFLYSNTKAQELFPTTESASSTPKGIFGLRAYTETYKEVNIPRNMFVVRMMYGITSRLSFSLSGSGSNHHDVVLPKDIVTHTHIGNQTIYYTQNRVYGHKYPYRFNGFSLYAKYRFLSIDAENRHFRMALYAQGSKVRSAHDEAEPRLIDDNSGYGGGLIITRLRKKLAVSFTTGFIKPDPYSEYANHQETELHYGNAFSYDLSIGYLMYPKKYNDYGQDNYNIYAEIMGKAYKQAKLFINDENIMIQSTSLKGGNYIDGVIGMQRIMNSNARLDLTMRIPLLSQSYTHFYPVFMVGWQRYFYFSKKKSRDAQQLKYEKAMKLKNEMNLLKHF